MGGRLWKLNENRVLRDLWLAGESNDALCQALPGRSANSIRSHAAKMGLGARFLKWTQEEDAILRDIWSGDGSLKSHLHRLPERTWRGAIHRAHLIGLKGRSPRQFVSKFSWVEAEIIEALSQSVPMTAQDIAKTGRASYVRIRQLLTRYSESKWHIVGWRHTRTSGTGNWSAVWMLGPGETAPKPALKTKSECARAYRAKRAIAKGRFDPFRAMSTPVQPIAAGQGRIFIHLTDSPCDEMEAA